MRKLSMLALDLYPYDFRAAFGEEMIALIERRPAGLREFLLILWHAAREWLMKLTSDRYRRARALPDVRMMRPPGISQEEWFLRKPWGSGTSA